MAEAVLLLGPTAGGKSALAMALAMRSTARGLPMEIVSVDSAQVYRGMDIGTAKPDAAERAAVPHHLLDVRDPVQPYSAADFARDAATLIADIRARGRLPLLVGGTMLYARALTQGLDELPAADPAIRARLERQAAAEGWPAMHSALAAVDPVTAARLSPNDSQRIQRALEVWELSGQPLSALHGRSAAAHRSLPIVALLPEDRARLHRRIEQRFDAMLAAGFLDEARQLVQRPDLHPDLPSQRSVGYRQAWDHLQGRSSAQVFREAAIAATRQLAKRQITWLRSMEKTAVLDPFAPDLQTRADEALRELVS